MTGMKDDLSMLSDQAGSLPVALPRRLRVLQRISKLRHHYAGALKHRVPTKLRNGLHGTTLKRRIPKLSKLSKPNTILLWVMIFLLLSCILYSSRQIFRETVTQIKLLWYACIIAPTGGQGHQERITNFYKNQASVYDETRKNLLKGRTSMLRLSAAHLAEYRKFNPGKRLVWVDIGGGTGYNIEAMDAFLEVDTFDAIYLVDICGPLLDVAKERFAARGWTNVHTIHDDATSFTLPEESWSDGTAGRESLSLVTFSYSLSMIPDFYAALDRISLLLAPGGIISAIDFYTSGAISQGHPSPADFNRVCGRLSRWFWQIWFDFDNVMLGPQRRDYLEHKFETVKVFNGRNRFMIPWLIRIPFYIWIGKARARESSARLPPSPVVNDSETRKVQESLFRNAPWRIPYSPDPWHDEMKTFIYSFTWEDPFEDMKYLDPTSPDDSLLVITSGGDNVLHYALQSKFRSIHCVDMNPCQGHLLELKLAVLKTLSYETVFGMFGKGHINSFNEILDSKLSPLLSAPCYQFWKTNIDMFDSSLSLYMRGYSGFALRVVKALFKISGRSHDVERMCNANSLAEQNHIWHHRIRPVILNPVVVWLLNNHWFCWHALGVPKNQRRMFLSEGTAYDYIRDTFDPVVASKFFKDGAYHYLMTLLGHYTPASCPLYLKRSSYDAFRAKDGELLDTVKIHTDTISGALKKMPSSSLSRAILMDHLDWFSEDESDVREEFDFLYRVLKPGGFVLLRSASRKPWYIQCFVSAGFTAMCLNVRKPGCQEALDHVNMYASFWKLQKIEGKA